MIFLSMKFNHTWSHSYAIILAAAWGKKKKKKNQFVSQYIGKQLYIRELTNDERKCVRND